MSAYALSLCDASDKLGRRELSSRELTAAVFARIDATDGQLQSYISLARASAEAAAAQADELLASGTPAAPLAGIPIAVKDNLLTRGIRTTCASKILGDFMPPYDATVIARLRAQGAVVLGKTNLDEFAMGSSTENSAFFPTRNPWDLTRVPGGSSGGSAAAVAADQCIAALGTDTGGSIRQPAAFCGIVGLKPTYGRVSRYGIIAFASSLDQVGPMTKDVRDAALLLEAVAGYDPADSTSAARPVPNFRAGLNGEVRNLRVGVPREYFVSGIQRDTDLAVRAAIRELEKSGAVIEELSLPHTDSAVAVYYLVATAEASSNLARYDGMRFGRRRAGRDLSETYSLSRAEGFGAEVKRRIMLGTYALSAGYYDAYYLKAQQVRSLIRRDFQEAFRRVDVIVTPTSPATAFKLGEKIREPLEMYLSDIYTIAANLAGLPALSLPCGFDRAGLPIGLQIIGKPFDEATMLNLAYGYEQSTAWHRKKPDLPRQDAA
jgi:aspartyl-tRNA(Asn)/glutamyl-tRNA(Gln) amidotransferase subunit A